VKLLAALITGILFGLGLAVSGMSDTEKVLGFLDLFGAWDISLMLVMCGGLFVSVPSYYWIKRRGRAVLDARLHLPQKTQISRELWIGAICFGIGWGLYGYCPGPAIVSLIYPESQAYWFLLAMLVGMFFAEKAAPFFSKV